MVVNGQKIAAGIIGRLKDEPRPGKFFAAVLVGDNQSSISFLKQKEKVAQELGVDFRLYKFPAGVKNDDLRHEVKNIADHTTCGGVIVQLPLPEHVNRHYVLNAIPREKDVDVLGERALGAFYTGRNLVLPPAVGVVQAILEDQNFDIASKKVAVVGSGLLIGKPIAIWLIGKASELFLLRSGSDLKTLKEADLVISGVGKSGLIKPETCKDGAAVIDFGYDVSKAQRAHGQSEIIGDLDTSRLAPSDSRLAFWTATPGGTGPILVAKLFENFFRLNQSYNAKV